MPQGCRGFQHPLTAVAPWCVESVQVELVPWLCCMAPAIALFATYFTAGTLRMRDFSGRHRKEIKGDQVTKHLHFLCSAFNTGAVAAGLFCKVIVMLCPSSNCCEVLSSVLCSAFLAEIVTAVLTFITWLWISNLSLASFAGVFKMRQAPSTATAVQQYRSVFLNLSEYTSTYINIECKN